jgi:hypothetical protein
MMMQAIRGARAQGGILAFIFGMIIFFIAWVFVLAKEINVFTGDAIASGSVTGVLAFLLGNMNLWLALFFIIALVWFLFAGGSQ